MNLQDLVLCNGTLRQPFEVGLLPALSEFPARSAFMAYPQKARRRVAVDSVRPGKLKKKTTLAKAYLPLNYLEQNIWTSQSPDPRNGTGPPIDKSGHSTARRCPQ